MNEMKKTLQGLGFYFGSDNFFILLSTIQEKLIRVWIKPMGKIIEKLTLK